MTDQMIQVRPSPGKEGLMQSYREVLDHLTRAHPNLSPQVRKAAAYVLENPGDVATLSMRKVAAAAQVPPPTLPRLAQALGFETYDSFREIYQRQFQERTVAYSEQADRLQRRQDGDGMDALLSAFRQASLANIEHLYAIIESDVVSEVAETLLAARTVYVAGMQASFPYANYFQYVGYMARSNWVLVHNRNGVLADGVVDLGPDDALVAIALQPCARDTIRLAQMARERGTTVVGITDSRTTPLAARSDFVLTVPCRSPQFFESYVSTTALLETIIGFVVAKSGQDAVQNIDRVELCRRELGEYWDND
jgi:DNA-binding MurR/RpiR family transcriptional regulator